MSVLIDYYRMSLLIEEAERALVPPEPMKPEHILIDSDGNEFFDMISFMTYWEGLDVENTSNEKVGRGYPMPHL